MPDNTNKTPEEIAAELAAAEAAKKVVPPEVAELVQAQVADALKPIKASLDSAYAARDEALAKVAKFEKEQRDAELKRLQDEGKHREAYDLEIKQERERREAAEQRNIELTRDLELRNALAAVSKDFRSANAKEMAYREIVSQLVKDSAGAWKHSSGLSIQDFVNGFAEKEENAFLFKQKVSTGGGSGTITPSPGDKTKTSLFAMSQEEVLQLAAEGKLPRRR